MTQRRGRGRLSAIDLLPVEAANAVAWAFNRHSIRLASMARRHEEARAITTALTDRLDPDVADDLTIMAAETIKTLVFELMEGSVSLSRSLMSPPKWVSEFQKLGRQS